METAPALLSEPEPSTHTGPARGQVDKRPLVSPSNADTARSVTPPNEGQPAPAPRRAGSGATRDHGNLQRVVRCDGVRR